MNNKKEINQVRQVLMNELGLTRESVRQLVEDIVAKEVKKHINKITFQGMIEQIVERKVNQIVNDCSWNRDAIKGMVVSQAEKQVGIFVKERLSFDVQKDMG